VKVTVPVGVPEVPVTLALSVAVKPLTLGVVFRLEVALLIVNASAVPVAPKYVLLPL